MDPKPTTFRVRRIPAEQDISTLPRFLNTSVEGLGGDHNIRVRSLAPSPIDRSINPTLVATIDFAEVPERLQDAEQEWTIYLKGSRKFLLFDKSFRGFTPLNHVQDTQHDFDCLAVSGLGSHPFGSWRQRSRAEGEQFMWLRDQLPDDFPRFRVMIYGYDTSLTNSDSHQSLDDLARTFVQHLKSIGRAEYSAKPCVIFAHSLGGILVKRALYYMARSGDEEDFVLQKMKLAIFFGVPNRGMEVKHLLSMVKGYPNEALVNTLSIDSSYLNILDEGFAGISAFRTMRIVSAYETRRSPTTIRNEQGKWERKGEREILVSRESAIQSGSRNPRDVFHIDDDHSNIVKLAPDDTTYYVIQHHLHDALLKTNPRWPVRAHHPADIHRMSPSRRTRNGARLMKQKHHDNVLCKDEACDVCMDQAADETAHGLGSETAHGSASETGQYVIDDGNYLQLAWSSKRRRRRDPNEELKCLRASLRFSEQGLRFDGITDASASSFGWLWKKDLKLMDWLLRGEGVYWIRGKPGSGKSTLMKYLYKNDNFRRELRSTAQVDLWFFFNERGGFLQKTFEGLLRTILYQLVMRVPELAKLILDIYMNTDDAARDQWNMAQLRAAFSAVLEQKDHTVELLVFLDALDEYHGFPEAIAAWIKDLAGSTNKKGGLTSVKVCFSSRPWHAFVVDFAKAPGFTLHEHTVQDIRQYAQAKVRPLCKQRVKSLASNLYWHSIPAGRVIEAIAEKAEGVFLWVRLATDMLAQHNHCDSDADFDTLLTEVPKDLEGFYARTLHRIPQNNRFEAFVLLEIVHRSPQLLDVKQLCLAAECANSNDFHICQQLINSKEASLGSSADAQQHLLNFCAGLLECVEVEKSETAYVQYIHRTAKDFVASPGFAELLLGERCDMQTDNGFTYLFRYTIAKQLSSHNPDERLLMLARADEMTTGRPQASFINSIPKNYFKATKTPCGYPTPLAFAVLADLKLYVQSTLANLCPSDILAIARMHLLIAVAWKALQCTTYVSDDLLAQHVQSYTRRPFNLQGMWKLLLAAKFDPQGVGNDGLSAWDVLIAAEPNRSFQDDAVGTTDDHLVEILESALKYAANPDVQVRYLPNSTLKSPGSSKWYWYLNAASGESLPGRFLYDRVRPASRVLQTLPALHLCNVKMSAILLKYGANPNLLDAHGHTALDVTILAVERISAREIYGKILLLMQHGGCVTMTGAKHWYETLQFVSVPGVGVQISSAVLTVPLRPQIKDAEHLAILDNHWKKEGIKKALLASRPTAESLFDVKAYSRSFQRKPKTQTRRRFGFLSLFKSKGP